MIAFCNVSFGDRYVQTQSRLKDSILKIYPDAKLFFWTDELPPGSKPFQESLYGFKVHAVNYARAQGYTKVVWIDTCAVLKDTLEPLFEAGFIAVKDENKLHRFCFERLRHMTDKEMRLVGGSLYLFDFNVPIQVAVFKMWEQMERDGLFGTQEEIMNEDNDGIDRAGHRMDETCMAIVLYHYMTGLDDGKLYQAVCEKKHFLEVGQKWYNK